MTAKQPAKSRTKPAPRKKGGKSTPRARRTGRAAKAPTGPGKPKNAVTPAHSPGKSPRTGTKQAQLIAMLERVEGATLEEIIAATGWQAHTVRGAISGSLKKKLGLIVDSEKVDNRRRVYRIVR